MTKRVFYFSVLVLSLLISCGQANPLKVNDLRCENLINPNAIDNTTPHFSWKVQYDKGDMLVAAYEILVGTDSTALINGAADLWNTGKVSSSSTVMIPYAGKDLESRDLCYWKVRLWNDKGEVSDWSNIARFGIGILDAGLIQGQYIGLSEEAGNITTPILRKKFTVDNPETSFLHVNSLGYHEVYINGNRVGDDVLSPAVSHLPKRSLMVTYDVSSFLNKGENEIVLWLGSGWYKKTTYGAEYDGPLVKAQLDVLNNNSWNTIVSTDSSWKGTPSGYRDTGTYRALQFGGERVEAALVPKDITSSTLDKLTWFPVVEVKVHDHKVSPEMTEPNKVQETILPKKIEQLGDDIWLVDLGKALNGWFEIKLPGLAQGQEILLEYTDYLDEGRAFLDQGQSDIYIASGNDDVFKNKFNHHTFQYVKISNLKTQPSKDDIKAYLIHSDYRTTSSFECSDPDLNAIHDMIQYTMKCLTFAGYMVDCAHLERAGYGGDGNSSTESLQIMYHVSPLFTNWLQAWDDSMREGGSLPHVAPNPGAGGGGPYWCGFMVMAPWRTYVAYNDPRLIERYYPSMKEWMKYVEKYTVDGLLKRWPDTEYRDWFLGDWLAPMGVDAGAQSSVDLVNNCFISECLATLEKIANVLGYPEEAEDFAKRREALNELLQKTFFDAETNIYSTGSQLDMSYPMLVGVTPEPLYDKVKEQLFTETREKYNGHIGCGLVGVPIFTTWTIRNKAVDFMYSILKKRDYPGYLYMIDKGASTTWEYWSGERSRVHNCYNGIGTWFYQAVGGIRPDEQNPGYKHVFIEPQIPEGVTWAKTTIDSPYGPVSVDWNKVNDKLTMKVVLPVGCKGTVILPANATNCKVNNKKTSIEQISVGNGTSQIEALLSI